MTLSNGEQKEPLDAKCFVRLFFCRFRRSAAVEVFISPSSVSLFIGPPRFVPLLALLLPLWLPYFSGPLQSRGFLFSGRRCTLTRVTNVRGTSTYCHAGLNWAAIPVISGGSAPCPLGLSA